MAIVQFLLRQLILSTFLLFILHNLLYNVTYLKLTVKEPTLVSYVHWFKQEAIEHGVNLNYDNLIIKFGDTNIKEDQPPAQGVCSRIGGLKKIVLNKQYFSIASESKRKALIAHEMGHCVLNRRHYQGCYKPKGYYDSGCKFPVSLMYKYELPVNFEEYEDYYMKELFSNYEYREIPVFE